VLAAFACTLGIVPHLLAAMLGLAALLHASALAFAVVKYAGVAYLLFMAWQTLQEHGALSVEAKADPRSAWRVLRDGIAINVLNPKLSIFFVAFLPQFIAAGEAAPLARMLELSGVFMAMTFVVFALYGLFAAAMRDKVVTRPAVMAWLRLRDATGECLVNPRGAEVRPATRQVWHGSERRPLGGSEGSGLGLLGMLLSPTAHREAETAKAHRG